MCVCVCVLIAPWFSPLDNNKLDQCVWHAQPGHLIKVDGSIGFRNGVLISFSVCARLCFAACSQASTAFCV